LSKLTSKTQNHGTRLIQLYLYRNLHFWKNNIKPFLYFGIILAANKSIDLVQSNTVN